jgi:hypothetical protein
MRTLALLLALGTTPAFAQDPGTPPAAPIAPAPAAPIAPAPAAPIALTVSPSSLVVALVYKQGAAAAVAHDHAVQAPHPTGSGVWSATDASLCKIDMSVKVIELAPDAPDIRERAGLVAAGPSEGQRQEIYDHIIDDYQLWAEKYNTIDFHSTSISGTIGDVKVTGDFTLHGTTKSITVPMKLSQTDDGLRARGKFRILQSDYGIKPFSALFGALSVMDTVDILLDITLVPPTGE